MSDVTLKILTPDDAPDLWRINEEGLPGVGKVNPEAMESLLELAEFALGAVNNEELVAFVIVLLPGTSYGSLNYAWFNERYTEFLYVDRIAVGQAARDRGIGTLLYDAVWTRAQEMGVPVAAEVNLAPPNPGSMRFHQRHGFSQVGSLQHPTYRVAMLMRGTTMRDPA